MDAELLATQRIVRILSKLTPAQRSNVLAYVGRRADQEAWENQREDAAKAIQGRYNGPTESMPMTLAGAGVGTKY